MVCSRSPIMAPLTFVTTDIHASNGIIHVVDTVLGTPTVGTSDTVLATPTVGTSDTVATCTVSASNTVNLRSGPGTTFDRAGELQAGQSVAAVARSNPVSGFVWYRLDSGSWVRQDVIVSSGACDTLPVEG